MKIPPIRPTFLLVLAACLIYAVVVVGIMMFMDHNPDKWRTGQWAWWVMGASSFVMAFVALFRGHK